MVKYLVIFLLFAQVAFAQEYGLSRKQINDNNLRRIQQENEMAELIRQQDAQEQRLRYLEIQQEKIRKQKQWDDLGR